MTSWKITITDENNMQATWVVLGETRQEAIQKARIEHRCKFRVGYVKVDSCCKALRAY